MGSLALAKKLKVWSGNLDGRRDAAVAAHSQKEAAAALHISLYQFRDYFEEQEIDDPDLAQAIAEPGIAFVRPTMASIGTTWDRF